jgi:hypothetical protein
MEQAALTPQRPATALGRPPRDDEADRERTVIEIATHRFQTPIVCELTRPAADAHMSGSTW